MELGTGVFLSAIFLGMVVLYIATKDRWNWKKILLWPLGITLAISVIGGTFGYLYKQYEEQPRKETAFWDISLGATFGDVKFAKGEPSRFIDENIWVYQTGKDQYERIYAVKFKEGKVNSVILIGGMDFLPHIQGISRFSTPQEIERKFGKPSHISRSKDELRRWYSFERYNIIVLFRQNEITALGIYDPTIHGPAIFIEEAKEVEPKGKSDSSKKYNLEEAPIFEGSTEQKPNKGGSAPELPKHR